MKGQYITRIIKLESAPRFLSDKRTKEERDADAWAIHERTRQELIDGTYQPPIFTDKGDIPAYNLEACWNAFLMDIPEYMPYLEKWKIKQAINKP